MVRQMKNAPTASRESVSKAVAGTHMRLHGLYMCYHTGAVADYVQ
ncbi:hypothetical protein SJA_C1-06190 [Sphingobium indicum UT26S]|uniref:Uncharacterized protein n=1 Tax=Sphingobium indicum (strain DSM 16413 / CCM 7287 / MTCC 6362 / UT26 / NBRC 101211 / UT26S) TaxID=452662 RepID=D4YYM1_SPHIU|nr:hypothetical protein SJA_C1-06190 [Sphingobium indicum UT26S]